LQHTSCCCCLSIGGVCRAVTCLGAAPGQSSQCRPFPPKLSKLSIPREIKQYGVKFIIFSIHDNVCMLCINAKKQQQLLLSIQLQKTGAILTTGQVRPLSRKTAFSSFLANANVNSRSRSRSLFVVVHPSVCLSSVCNVRAPYTQAIEIFGNVSTFYAIWYAGHLLSG